MLFQFSVVESVTKFMNRVYNNAFIHRNEYHRIEMANNATILIVQSVVESVIYLGRYSGEMKVERCVYYYLKEFNSFLFYRILQTIRFFVILSYLFYEFKFIKIHELYY